MLENKINIAITGSSGLIGSHMIFNLLDYNCKLLLITNQPEKIDLQLTKKNKIKIIKGNINESMVHHEIVKNKIDLMINFYAQTDLYFAEKNILADFQVNILPIVNLFSFLNKEKYKLTFLQLGTVTQSGITPKDAINEDFNDSPVSIFDYHKLCAEKYVKYFNQSNYINGYCFRLSNVYGGNTKYFSENRGVINKVIKAALKHKSITIFGDGNYLRDYIHIDDVVNCIKHSIKIKERLFGKHFLLCSGKSYTIKEVWTLIAKIIKDMYSIDVIIEYKDWPKHYLEIEKRDFIADNSLLMKTVGFKPSISIEDGLLRNINLIYNQIKK